MQWLCYCDWNTFEVLRYVQNKRNKNVNWFISCASLSDFYYSITGRYDGSLSLCHHVLLQMPFFDILLQVVLWNRNLKSLCVASTAVLKFWFWLQNGIISKDISPLCTYFVFFRYTGYLYCFVKMLHR